MASESPSPSPSESPTEPPPLATPVASARRIVTPPPNIDALPNIPIGRASSATGDAPASGMVRLVGHVQRADKSPAPRVCVTLGPPIACVLLTDDQGNWIVDVLQGAIAWEFHFVRGGVEVAPAIQVRGPFAGQVVGVSTVVVK